MAGIVKGLNPVLGYKGNKYKEYKWILVLLNFRELAKE